jgi:AraC-like DNA-binding protein
MKQELENALKSTERVTLSAVAQQFGWDSRGLRKRFPDLCRAVVTHYHERFDYEQVRRRLQDVLTSDEGTPSVDELARQMGYGRNIFRTNFPDLCKQVSERRSAALRNHHNERMATFVTRFARRRSTCTVRARIQVKGRSSDPQANASEGSVRSLASDTGRIRLPHRSPEEIHITSITSPFVLFICLRTKLM